MLAADQEYGTSGGGESGVEASCPGAIGKSRRGEIQVGGIEVPQQATGIRDRGTQVLEWDINAEIEI